MTRLIPATDPEGVALHRPPRRGLWGGGVEQLDHASTRAALAAYSREPITAVYRLYAVDGSLLYVGITVDPLRRWKQHAATKGWWVEVDHILLVPFSTEDDARDTERRVIRNEQPLYNIQHRTVHL